jgi:hypothetical protein
MSDLKIPDHSETAQLCLMASTSMAFGLIARSFPAFRLWLGIIPTVIVSAGLAWWGLSNHWGAWREHSQRRVGRVREHGPVFWDFGRLVEVFGPCGVFLLCVGIGVLAG